MKYSSFNWVARGKRGWIIGPFMGRTLTITWERQHPCPSFGCALVANHPGDHSHGGLAEQLENQNAKNARRHA